MAKNEAKDEIRQQSLQKKKEREFRAACKQLDPHPYAAAGALVIALLLLFVSWVEIYNTDIPGTEIRVRGWSAALCALTGNYSSFESVFGNMDIFNYWAPEYCAPLGVFALLSACALLVALALEIVTLAGKKYALHPVSAVVSLAGAAFLIASFAAGLAFTGSELLPGYCDSNPACSVRSFAIIPAVLALMAAAVSIAACVRYFRARKLLK